MCLLLLFETSVEKTCAEFRKSELYTSIGTWSACTNQVKYCGQNCLLRTPVRFYFCLWGKHRIPPWNGRRHEKWEIHAGQGCPSLIKFVCLGPVCIDHQSSENGSEWKWFRVGAKRNHLWVLPFSWTFSAGGDAKSPPLQNYDVVYQKHLLVPGTPHTEGLVREYFDISKVERASRMRTLAVGCWVHIGNTSRQYFCRMNILNHCIKYISNPPMMVSPYLNNAMSVLLTLTRVAFSSSLLFCSTSLFIGLFKFSSSNFIGLFKFSSSDPLTFSFSLQSTSLSVSTFRLRNVSTDPWWYVLNLSPRAFFDYLHRKEDWTFSSLLDWGVLEMNLL